MGQRIAKQVGTGNTEVYILDGATTLGVFTVNSGGTATSWYFNLHAGDRVVGRHPSTGTRSYYYTDMLGSTRSVVQSATVVESYDFEPWGLQMPGRTLGSGTKEGFTGKEQDSETGLDYFGARYYMPALGRWASVDPLNEKQAEWNPYNYTLDNPVTSFDPSGQESVLLEGAEAQNFFRQMRAQNFLRGGNGRPRNNTNRDSRDAVTASGPCDNLPPEACKGWMETLQHAQDFWNDAVLFTLGLPRKIMAFTSFGDATTAFTGVDERAEQVGVAGRLFYAGMALTGPVSQGFRIAGRLEAIWNNRRMFTGWLRGSQSLARIGDPLSHAEARQLIANARRLGIRERLGDFNPRGLAGLEQTGRWAHIPHFKIGGLHIPVAMGFSP